MRYLLLALLGISGILGLSAISSSVGAVMTVSGEVQVKPPSQDAGYISAKRKLTALLIKAKKEIATLNTQIAYVEKRIASRARMKLDNSTFEKKLTELKEAKKKAENTLSYIQKKIDILKESFTKNLK